MKLPVVIFIQQKENLRLLIKLASGYNMQESDMCVCEFCKESNQEQQKNATIGKKNIFPFVLACLSVSIIKRHTRVKIWRQNIVWKAIFALALCSHLLATNPASALWFPC